MLQSSDTQDPQDLARTMRRAWEEFFTSGEVLPSVRPEIAESWLRSRRLGIPPSLRTQPLDDRGLDRLLHTDLRQLLIRASTQVLDYLVDATEGSNLSFTLTDADGLILVQRGSKSHLADNERIGVVRGTRWAELDVGTNGIGTALTRRQTMRVFAAEHYCEAFHDVMCTAAIVRDPLTGQPLGVFDVTSSYAEPTATVWAVAEQAAALIGHEIQQLLLSNGERLLETLAAQQHDQPAYVVDRECTRVITNRGAMTMLGPEDYSALWTYVRRCLQEGEVHPVPHMLKSGKSVLVDVKPVRLAEEPVGAVVVLRENHRHLLAKTRVEDWSPFSATAQWLAPARALLRSTGPVLVVGEPGSGKSSLLAALVRAMGEVPQSIDCAAVDNWATCQAILETSKLVVLERLLDLDPALQARLVSVLDRRNPPRILATACVADEVELRSALLRQDLVDRLAVNVVRIPPLRERGDEIEGIILDSLQEHARKDGQLARTVSTGALRILRGYAWPGNVRQLQNVIGRVVLGHTRDQLDVEDLPPEVVLAAVEPRLGLIDQLEGEAILRTLQSTGGNISKAAQMMGLSRATVYRRLHAYRAQHAHRVERIQNYS
jgi:sigma-54 dependent transcriptional regulator, acetoin dehydrogenase operon transcriptional activator AcoR